MIAPVSALSDKPRYQIEPGMPHNAIKVYMDDGCSMIVAPQVGNVDLVEVLHMPSALKSDITHWLMSEEGQYRGVLGLTLAYDRYRGRIGARPIIRAYHHGEFLRVFVPSQRIVNVEHVYERRLAG